MGKKISFLAVALFLLTSLAYGGPDKPLDEGEDKNSIAEESVKPLNTSVNALEKSEKGEAVTSTSPSRQRDNAKSVVWSSLPQPPSVKKVIIGEQERWVDVGAVPSLQERQNNAPGKRFGDFRSKSVSGRLANKTILNKRKTDGEKQRNEGLLVDLGSYGNDEIKKEPNLDEEEIKQLIEKAKKLNAKNIIINKG